MSPCGKSSVLLSCILEKGAIASSIYSIVGEVNLCPVPDCVASKVDLTSQLSFYPNAPGAVGVSHQDGHSIPLHKGHHAAVTSTAT